MSVIVWHDVTQSSSQLLNKEGEDFHQDILNCRKQKLW